MRRTFVIYFATVILLLPARGEGAIQFDFMSTPKAFDSAEAQRLFDEINLEKLSQSAKDLGGKLQQKSPELLDDLEALKDKTSETADKSTEWLENEAGIDLLGILKAIGGLFRDVFEWMVLSIKKILS